MSHKQFIARRSRRFRTSWRTLLAVGLISAGAGSLQAQSSAAVEAPKTGGDAEKADDLGSVVVTARNKAEQLQEIPVPVSVIDDKTIERENIATVFNFAEKVPNFSYTAMNSRWSNLSIRGVGKNNANEAFEPSVGIIIDNVYISHPGSVFSDLPDLERIEVLRGPQGTLLGKNTTLGVLNIVSKAPSFTPSAWFSVGYGDRDTTEAKFNATGGVIPGLLAIRTSFTYANGQGPFKNTINPNTTANDKNRYAGKVQLLLTPSPSLSARIIVDRSKALERTWPMLNLADPDTYSDGVKRSPTYSSRLARDYFQAIKPNTTPINNWNYYDADDYRPVRTEHTRGSAEVNWTNGEWTVTSITARNIFLFEPTNDETPYLTSHGGIRSRSGQNSQEIRLASPNWQAVDFQAGLYWLNNKNWTQSQNVQDPTFGPDAGAFFASDAQYKTLWTNGGAAGAALLRTSLEGYGSSTVTHPESTSKAVYTQANWHLTKKVTVTTGLRFNAEDRDNDTMTFVTNVGQDLGALGAKYNATAAQIAAAKAIRSTRTTLQPFISASGHNDSVSWLVSPSYQYSKDILFYTSASYGEKSPVVSFFNGAPNINSPEKVTNIELGIKSLWLNRKLRFNVNVYHTDIKDYQTTIRVLDPTKTDGSFVSRDGNAPKVRTQGVEVESAYSLTKEWSLTFSGAYNDAVYKDFKYGALALEADPAASLYTDYTGKRVNSAPKYSASVGVTYEKKIGIYRFHSTLSNAFKSSFNADQTLSNYAWQDAYHVWNASAGVSFLKGKYDLTLSGRNLLDEKYFTAIYAGSSSNVLVRAATGERRTVLLTFRANF
ncbi:MAG: TonB-dependent receptor [Opitutaceae bacterium]|jgi:iron complex outermembrane receptor protein